MLHLLTRLRVESAEGFVHQEDLGAKDQGARQSDALVLAARELGRAKVALGPEADRFEHLVDASLRLGLGDALLPELEPKGKRHVLPDGEVGPVRVALEDHHRVVVGGVAGGAADEDASLGRRLHVERAHAADHPQQGRLPAARWAQQHVDGRAFELEIDLVEDADHTRSVGRGILLDDLLERDLGEDALGRLLGGRLLG